MSENLKPCPFCGKIPEIDQTGFVWHVKGSKPLCPFGTHGVHATAWNRRASGWISVKDRLPEKDDRYVCLARLVTGATLLTVCYFSGAHKKFAVEAAGIATHWQPLPSAPEVEE